MNLSVLYLTCLGFAPLRARQTKNVSCCSKFQRKVNLQLFSYDLISKIQILELTLCKQADLPLEALDFLEAHSAQLVHHVVELDYDYWTAGTDSYASPHNRQLTLGHKMISCALYYQNISFRAYQQVLQLLDTSVRAFIISNSDPN